MSQLWGAEQIKDASKDAANTADPARLPWRFFRSIMAAIALPAISLEAADSRLLSHQLHTSWRRLMLRNSEKRATKVRQIHYRKTLRGNAK